MAVIDVIIQAMTELAAPAGARALAQASGLKVTHTRVELGRHIDSGRYHVAAIAWRGDVRLGARYAAGPAPPGHVAADIQERGGRGGASPNKRPLPAGTGDRYASVWGYAASANV